MAETKTAAVERPACGVVQAEVLGMDTLYDDSTPEPQQTFLVKCPRCKQPLVMQQWWFDEYWSVDGTVGSWSTPKRVWPRPEVEIPWELPEIVRESLVEAQKCLRAQAYTAAAVMSARALEGLCRDLNADDSMLAKGLDQLHEAGKIDDRLYEWGRELNKKRRIAAHPDPNEEITQGDAQYVFEFVLAVCDYAYVLTAKFERFKAGK
jgi:hypothetical protein